MRTVSIHVPCDIHWVTEGEGIDVERYLDPAALVEFEIVKFDSPRVAFGEFRKNKESLAQLSNLRTSKIPHLWLHPTLLYTRDSPSVEPLVDDL